MNKGADDFCAPELRDDLFDASRLKRISMSAQSIGPQNFSQRHTYSRKSAYLGCIWALNSSEGADGFSEAVSAPEILYRALLFHPFPNQRADNLLASCGADEWVGFQLVAITFDPKYVALLSPNERRARRHLGVHDQLIAVDLVPSSVGPHRSVELRSLGICCLRRRRGLAVRVGDNVHNIAVGSVSDQPAGFIAVRPVDRLAFRFL
jgi:hypothetical protein